MRRLRVLIVTTDDPLYINRFFEVFFRDIPRDRVELCGVTVGRTRQPRPEVLRRLVGLYGPLGFVRLWTRYARSRLGGGSIARQAARHGVPVLPAGGSVNDPRYVARVRALAPDVIVSVAAPEIFRDELLASAPLGCINLHSGALPAYRGVLPTFWQMLHGEPEVTLTIHGMGGRIDVGPVLATARVPLAPRDSLHRVLVEAKRAGARLLIDTLGRMAEGPVQPRPMDLSRARWHRFPSASDARAFRARGHSLF